jgi:hypothetical protein
MRSHLAALLVFSALASTVLATLARDGTPARLRFGLRLFAGLVLGVVALGWVMHGLPD